MNVGQLKQSLARFSPEKDNTEVIFMHNVEDKDYAEDIAFVAYADLPDNKGLVCILGTKSSADSRMKKGTLKYPEGQTPDGVDLSADKQNNMSEYVVVKMPYSETLKKGHYLKFAKNIYTQFGEDGIIKELFKDLNINGGVLVEFGAWDGMYCSNTYNLWRDNKNFKVILIESDTAKYNEMIRLFGNLTNVECINACISYNKDDANSLDNVLSKSKFVDYLDNISLMCIDVDSCDYYIFESICKYLPKVFVVEAGIGDIYDMYYTSYTDGCSLKSTTELATTKGYKLVCHTGNGIFVRDDLMSNIPAGDYTPEKLFCNHVDSETLARLDKDGNSIGEFYFKSQIYFNIMNGEKERCLFSGTTN